jgi:hypothetical protein
MSDAVATPRQTFTLNYPKKEVEKKLNIYVKNYLPIIF